MNLAYILDEGLENTPRKTLFTGDGRSYTYNQVVRASENLATGLRRLGYAPGCRIAVMLPNLPEYGLAMYGLWWLGAQPVLINPQLTLRELRHILLDSQAQAVITTADLLPTLAPLRCLPPMLTFIVVGGEVPAGDLSFAELTATAGRSGIQRIHPTDTAALLYTSGTTGEPKAALLTHGNFWAIAQSSRIAIEGTPKDHLLCVLPLFHSFGCMVALVLFALMGASVTFEHRLTPKRLMEHLRDPRLSFLIAVPNLLSTLLRFPADFRLTEHLRCVCCGGSALHPQVEADFRARFGDIVRQGYGLTECVSSTTLNPLPGPVRPGSIGKPLPGGPELAVCDPHTGALLGERQVGELLIRGPHVFKGYHNRPEASAAVFLDGWLRSGDLGYRDADGYYFVVDRIKDVIIVSGQNVYSQEVEKVLLSHRAVREAAVVGDPDPDKGEVVHAYVSLHEGATVGEAELVHYARSQLAPIKVPRRLTVVEALPKSPTGRILKRRLRPQAAAADPEASGVEVEHQANGGAPAAAGALPCKK
ncbi:long-chain-fatty-acid--CoA ligase [Gloeobacter morelensis]|uniref:Long-chain fatty acid--CoA ligase n=1 Tax=Gloeobacter morelensis MG652769 TaxID=2781736 RepID=A0ABY3PM07_9CYAN|nr:long-chain fatty acid--CoA ligase [Gloeobacter morelensis]UFP94727.1 long-chain fatty acid--CoA ligase [Gloeobacter morelensis MG652769]